jgi:hypothetical protein
VGVVTGDLIALLGALLTLVREHFSNLDRERLLERTQTPDTVERINPSNLSGNQDAFHQAIQAEFERQERLNPTNIEAEPMDLFREFEPLGCSRFVQQLRDFYGELAYFTQCGQPLIRHLSQG